VDWFSFALLGAASLAFTGVIDKFILEKYVSNSYSYLVCLILFHQIFAVGILFTSWDPDLFILSPFMPY